MSHFDEIASRHYETMPKRWQTRKVKFVSDVQASNVDKASADDEEAVRLCNYVDVYYHDQITPDIPFMEATATPTEIARFSLRRGQVIITKDSESWDDIGISALVSEDMPEVLCGYHLAILSPHAEKLDGGFLAWLCRADALNDQFKLSANGVTRFGLGQYAMKNAVIGVPPLDVQRRIATYLDQKTELIDTLIKKKRSLLERLAEKRQVIITQAVTKGLDRKVPTKDSGIEWLGQIPAHWEVKKLRHAAENLNRMRVPIAAELRKGIERLYPYYGASGIIDYVDEYIFNFETVLVAEDGANLLSRSTPLAFSASGEYWVNNHAHILRPIDMTIWYCAALLALYPLEPHISGSAQPKLTKDSLMSLPICSPPVAEQHAIELAVSGILERLDAVSNECETSIGILSEYRSTL
ncbi:MAG TPA: restriction endonuclease subunit S, partial [Rhizomicrobium sp.]|nr:restriction endonuclease subunit S [Rhizomicrobium sp.]